jgi:hypothetical protein
LSPTVPRFRTQFAPRVVAAMAVTIAAVVVSAAVPSIAMQVQPAVVAAAAIVVGAIAARRAGLGEHPEYYEAPRVPNLRVAAVWLTNVGIQACGVMGDVSTLAHGRLHSFSLLLRVDVQLHCVVAASVFMAIIALLAGSLTESAIPLDPGGTAFHFVWPPLVALAAAAGTIALSSQVPAEATVDHALQRLNELEAADPLSVAVRDVVIDATNFLLGGERLAGGLGGLWTIVAVPVVVSFAACGASAWAILAEYGSDAEARDDGATWKLIVCGVASLTVLLLATMALQFYVLGAGGGLVQQCVARSTALGRLLIGERLHSLRRWMLAHPHLSSRASREAAASAWIRAAYAAKVRAPETGEARPAAEWLRAALAMIGAPLTPGDASTAASSLAGTDGDGGEAGDAGTWARNLAAWHAARTFVLEVDCVFVLSSTGWLFGATLGVAFLLVIAVLGLAFMSEHVAALIEPAQLPVTVFVVSSVGMLSMDALLVLWTMLDVYPCIAAHEASLRSIHRQQLDESVLCVGAARASADQTAFVGRLADEVAAEVYTPTLLGLTVRPQMVQVAKGYLLSSAVALTYKVVDDQLT